MKKLYKIEEGKKLLGVCGGLADYFDIDASLVRILLVFICMWKGIGIIIYFIAAMVLPTKREVEAENRTYEGEYTSHYD